MVMRLSEPGPPAVEAIRLPGKGAWLALCDATASGAEDAQVRLAKGVSVLDLCAHHLGVHGLDLLAAGWSITHDNRGALR